MTHFKLLASGLDVSKLAAEIASQPDLFDEVTDRQDYPGSAHRDSKTIFLRWCKGLDVKSAFSEIPAFDFPAMGKLATARELINYAIHRAGAQQLGRVLVVSLRPGGVVTPHADEGAYADFYERFHIVLKSEPGNIFRCEDETVEMKTGDLWCFNHKTEHEVRNMSDSNRIHLIIDMVAPEFRRERMNHEDQHAV